MIAVCRESEVYFHTYKGFESALDSPSYKGKQSGFAYKVVSSCAKENYKTHHMPAIIAT